MSTPVIRRHKTHICSMSPEVLGYQGNADNWSIPASTAWVSANRAIFLPMKIQSPFLVKAVYWSNGATASGNVDVGVYTRDGKRLLSGGGTAQSGTTTIQAVTLGTPVLLNPGGYMLAMVIDNGTGTTHRVAPTVSRLNVIGVMQMAAAYPLPATVTYAVLATSYVPMCGIASTTLV